MGTTYFWCSCGRSCSQPFCDGSHLGTKFEPLEFVCEEYKYQLTVCGCKQSKEAPLCDGTCVSLAKEPASAAAADGQKKKQQ